MPEPLSDAGDEGRGLGLGSTAMTSSVVFGSVQLPLTEIVDKEALSDAGTGGLEPVSTVMASSFGWVLLQTVDKEAWSDAGTGGFGLGSTIMALSVAFGLRTVDEEACGARCKPFCFSLGLPVAFDLIAC